MLGGTVKATCPIAAVVKFKPLRRPSPGHELVRSGADIIHIRRSSAKSFVDDLSLSRGVVKSRAAASLRSSETQPTDCVICPLQTGISHARGIAEFAHSAHSATFLESSFGIA